MNEKVKYLLVLGAFIILCMIGYFSMQKDEVVIQASSEHEVEEESIYVHIEGCVYNPGLIKVPKGTRMFELIELAGGETDDADLSKINLASIVSDAQKVYIPQVIVYDENEESVTSISRTGVVNINTATSSELQTLDGIGPSMASKIIDYREKNGYFTQPEDIMNVSGIGESKYNKIKDKITI
ncbi:MAG: helix-hairpin-helix domain-containing protein [Clostridia bacterium]|nr:helix-hairpin-helix domain-containing protein [Clostridia bacterium]